MRGYAYTAIVLVITATVLLGIGAIPESAGTIYKYLDKNGTECLTDDISSVPKEYRKKAVVINNQKDQAEKAKKEQEKEKAEKKDTLTIISDFAKDFVSGNLFKIIAPVLIFCSLYPRGQDRCFVRPRKGCIRSSHTPDIWHPGLFACILFPGAFRGIFLDEKGPFRFREKGRGEG